MSWADVVAECDFVRYRRCGRVYTRRVCVDQTYGGADDYTVDGGERLADWRIAPLRRVEWRFSHSMRIVLLASLPSTVVIRRE